MSIFMNDSVINHIWTLHPRPAMCALVGSRNYQCHLPNSDYDAKMAYFPTFHEFFKGRFTHRNVLDYKFFDTTIDWTLAPIHELVRHVMKGNPSFVETLWSICWRCDPDFESVADLLASHARHNLVAIGNAALGTAHGKITRLSLYTESTQWMKDKYGMNLKEAAHAYRLIDFVEHIMNHSSFDFNVAPEVKKLIRGEDWTLDPTDTRAYLIQIYDKITKKWNEVSPDIKEANKKVLEELANEIEYELLLACQRGL